LQILQIDKNRIAVCNKQKLQLAEHLIVYRPKNCEDSMFAAKCINIISERRKYVHIG